jgi:hypothetical protein
MRLFFNKELINILVTIIPFSKLRVLSDLIYSICYIRRLLKLLHLFKIVLNHFNLLFIYLLK